MIRDYETGNITYVNYETYEEMKENYENEIEVLKERIEELEDELQTKKDSLVVANESIKKLWNQFIYNYTQILKKVKF